MLTNECWLGQHDYCSVADHCECMCHDSWTDNDLASYMHLVFIEQQRNKDK